MTRASPPTLSETAQLVLGAFAMADSHTLSAELIASMARGAVDEAAAARGLEELRVAGQVEVLAAGSDRKAGCFRLTRSGLELTLELQAALSSRRPPAGD